MQEISISSIHKTAFYQLKPGTSTSFYIREGEALLPNRICISKYEFAEAKRTGRNLHPVAGQIKATYTKAEASKYKQFKPYVIHTNIWEVREYPEFVGYGSIGITNAAGRIHETGDLIILYSMNTGWDNLEIHFFPGMLKELHTAFVYLKEHKRRNP